MGLAKELEDQIRGIFKETWETRDGKIVPEPADVGLGNKGVHIEATILYADLARSTILVMEHSELFAAEVYKAFLAGSARIIRANEGKIRSYDGDRIMGIFIGGSKNTNAAKTALQINYLVSQIIKPALVAQYPKNTYQMSHCVGIDTSKVMAARTGVRNDNDLVWVGRSANFAAKLCDLRIGDYRSWMTKAVYDVMANSSKLSSDGKNMWLPTKWPAQGDMQIYGSTWRWKP